MTKLSCRLHTRARISYRSPVRRKILQFDIRWICYQESLEVDDRQLFLDR